MEDLYLSLFIILLVGMVIGLIFYFHARKKRELRLRLEAYCSQHGYQMDEVKQRLHRAVVIQGDGWKLTTGVQSSDVETQSGSAYTSAYTRWETIPNAEECTPLIWLGTVSGSTALLGDKLLPLLSMFGIDGMEHTRFVELDESLNERFAMITTDRPALTQAGVDISRLLVEWPEN